MDTFYVGAAEGTAWPLTVDQVEAVLQARTPTVHTNRGHAAVSDKDYVWFNAEAEGATIECLYTDQFSLTISDCEPAQAAEILVWFFGLLPADAPTVVLTETNPTPTPLGLRRDRPSLEAALSALSAA
jgi:hypothetical protein